MKLLLKFDLILVTLAALGLLVVAFVAHNFLQQNARSQVLQQAEAHDGERQLRPPLHLG